MTEDQERLVMCAYVTSHLDVSCVHPHPHYLKTIVQNTPWHVVRKYEILRCGGKEKKRVSSRGLGGEADFEEGCSAIDI